MAMTLTDITNAETCSRTPHIAYNDLQFLWVTDYREDIRSGMLIYQGEEYFYQVFAKREERMRVYRRFAVLRLSTEQVADEKRWHEQLQERAGGGRTFEWWIEAYRQRPQPDYSMCEMIGWFEC